MGWRLWISPLQSAVPHHWCEVEIGKIAGLHFELVRQPGRGSPVAGAELRNHLPQGVLSWTYPKRCDGLQQRRGQLLPSISAQLPSIGPELPPIRLELPSDTKAIQLHGDSRAAKLCSGKDIIQDVFDYGISLV